MADNKATSDPMTKAAATPMTPETVYLHARASESSAIWVWLVVIIVLVLLIVAVAWYFSTHRHWTTGKDKGCKCGVKDCDGTKCHPKQRRHPHHPTCEACKETSCPVNTGFCTKKKTCRWCGRHECKSKPRCQHHDCCRWCGQRSCSEGERCRNADCCRTCGKSKCSCSSHHHRRHHQRSSHDSHDNDDD